MRSLRNNLWLFAAYPWLVAAAPAASTDPCAKIAGLTFVPPAEALACYKAFPFNQDAIRERFGQHGPRVRFLYVRGLLLELAPAFPGVDEQYPRYACDH